eukprot:GFYU01009997.1.p1 GENE.GFYU01009997.1~~GFYU01009997.1.p1  ORF type:complete len:347 (-),score=101.70 GFYU01009997.1:101-1141(-)
MFSSCFSKKKPTETKVPATKARKTTKPSQVYSDLSGEQAYNKNWDHLTSQKTKFAKYLGLMKKTSLLDSTGALKGVTKDDVLIVVDMQKDFMPESVCPGNGRFGVAEGEDAADAMVELIHHFNEAKATIVATRDYHPMDHASFDVKGGPFPAHCVQGSEGAEFYEPIREALEHVQRSNEDNLHIVYKGFNEEVDSFGAFPYDDDYAEKRISYHNRTDLQYTEKNLHCSLSWTGAYKLKCSSQDDSLNAPPDILAIRNSVTLKDILKKKDRIFVVGLALDFCVLDTAVTGAIAKFRDIYVVLDASRAAFIPGATDIEGGFLTDPADIESKFDKYDLQMVMTPQILSK